MTLFNTGIAIIFFLAIVHTFFTPQIHAQAKILKMNQIAHPYKWRFYYFLSEFCNLNSEIELIFGLWLIPLFLWASLFTDWQTIQAYLLRRDYTFVLYIMVIVVVIGSRPIISFAEKVLEFVARLGGDTAGAWWLTIMTIGPILGSLLKEPGAMALSAILLAKKFYLYQPSRSFQYATLGLLFSNISVGGLLTPHSSRALFIAAKTWKWDTQFMLTHFGWKLLIAIVILNFIYYFIFRKNFQEHFPKRLPTLEKDEERKPTPLWISLVHLLFVIMITIFALDGAIFMGLFLLYLGFHQVTRFYQTKMHIKQAALVGFFFASLMIHGELQGFWITPLLRDFGQTVMVGSSFILSALVDNAIVNYLAVQIPSFSPQEQYLLVAATMSAGGLTVIANVTNPLGLTILRHSFHEEVSLGKLFLGALFPSLFYFTIFILL